MAKVSWKEAERDLGQLRSRSGMPLSKMPTTVAIAAANEPSRAAAEQGQLVSDADPEISRQDRADDDLRGRVAQESALLDQARAGSTPSARTPARRPTIWIP